MARITIKRDDKTEVTFFAAVERFLHSRTTSVVTEYLGVTYILYEGGGAVYYKKDSRERNHAEWAENPLEEIEGSVELEVDTQPLEN
jgi:hypothetical protein